MSILFHITTFFTTTVEREREREREREKRERRRRSERQGASETGGIGRNRKERGRKE